jgi:hypothetical protein
VRQFFDWSSADPGATRPNRTKVAFDPGGGDWELNAPAGTHGAWLEAVSVLSTVSAVVVPVVVDVEDLGHLSPTICSLFRNRTVPWQW